MTVYSAYTGNNSNLIEGVAALYSRDGMTIADVTYGKGVFWKKIDLSKIVLLASDVSLTKELEAVGGRKMDFRKLEYENESVDIVVLDPPYIHSPGKHMTDARYNNAATTKGMYHNDIMNLYRQGMEEAKRVLRTDGTLWVKCKDQIMSGEQRWSHIDLFNIAKSLGYIDQDLFVLLPDSRTSPNRWDRQLHARKNHSYLWVFKKGGPARDNG